METPKTFEQIGVMIAGYTLRALCELLRIRVTSWTRSETENASIAAASPTSYHLFGGAVDMGRETPESKRKFLELLGYKVEWHEKGTATHWHVYGGWKAVAIVGASSAVIAKTVATVVSETA